MHTCKLANSRSNGPITNLLSVLCVLTEVLSLAHAKRGESPNGFRFGTFIARSQTDGAASTAVKGLKCIYCLIGDNGRLQHSRFCLLKCMFMWVLS